jgi:hypothetical protein
MNENKKYFGMTVTQLGILAGLAGLAFLSFCITGFLILGTRLGSVTNVALATIPADVPQPTVTLSLPPTATSTPEPTPVPYESLIPNGWEQYRTALYEIWMPPGYKAVKTADILVTGLGGSPSVDLALRGATSSKSPNKIYLTVSYEPMNADTFESFLNTRLAGLGLAPGERSKVALNTVPAVRLVFSGRKGSSTDINELTYVFVDGSTVWYVQYTAEITDYFNLLSTFEQSARTFRTVK